MMLLPSGRSNGDVHPVNNTSKPQFLARTSSPQLSLNSDNKPENGGYALSSTTTTTMATSYASSSTLSTSPSNATHTIQMHKTGTGNMFLSNSPGSQSETGTTTAERFTSGPKVTFLSNTKVSSSAGALATVTSVPVGNWEENDRHLEALQTKLKDDWSVHLGKEGRLYYCK